MTLHDLIAQDLGYYYLGCFVLPFILALLIVVMSCLTKRPR